MVVDHEDRVVDHALAVGLAVRTLRRAHWLAIFGDTVLGGAEVALEAGEVDTLDEIAVNRGAQMSEIADGLQVTRSTATRAVDRLVKRGFAERYRDPDFGRLVRVQLTKHGLAVHRELVKKRVDFTRRVFERFDPDEQEAIGRLLPQLTALIVDELESLKADSSS